MKLKKIVISTIIGLLCFAPLVHAATTAKTTTKKKAPNYRGEILIEKESNNRLWYVNPADGTRYYLRDGIMLFDVVRSLGVGVTNKDIKKIALAKGTKSDQKILAKFSGRFLIQAQGNGEAWYVNPADGVRYYLKNGSDAYDLLKTFGTIVTDAQLKTIPMNSKQIVYDTTFDDITHARYDGKTFSKLYNGDQIVPMASLTKLTTALVLLDLGLQWDKQVTITPEIINYPHEYVGNDATSEVGMSVGDVVTIQDLWIAMLVASSNQSAAALVDNSGLTRQQFVARMNAKAKELGLKRTIFYDVAGLDAGNVTTAKEMAKIAAAAFGNGRLANDSVLTEYTINAIGADGMPKTIPVTNRNYSLLKFAPTGAKVGYLVEARSTVAIKKDKVIYVVLHAKGVATRNKVLASLFPPN